LNRSRCGIEIGSDTDTLNRCERQRAKQLATNITVGNGLGVVLVVLLCARCFLLKLIARKVFEKKPANCIGLYFNALQFFVGFPDLRVRCAMRCELNPLAPLDLPISPT
jgi:hypothetical protein